MPAITINAPGIDAYTFCGSPSIAAGSVAISAPSIDPGVVVGTPSVVSSQTGIAAPSIAAALTAYPPTISGHVAGSAVAWKLAGVELLPFRTLGALAGCRVVGVAGANGPGNGTLATDGNGYLRWTAPGSLVDGDAVYAGAGGTVLLYDGDDPDKWIRLTVTAARLPAGPATAIVSLRAGLNVGCNDANVAWDASFPVVTSVQLTLANQTPKALTTCKAWIDPDCDSLEISWDGVNWYSHTSESAAGPMGSQTIAASGTRTLYTRRTIGGGETPEPLRIVRIHIGFDDAHGGRSYSQIRGGYRLQGKPLYRIYRKLGSVPVPGVDAIWEETDTLPYQPSSTFADGIWFIALTWFNGYVESAVRKIVRLELVSGVERANPPDAPKWGLTLRPGGVVRVTGYYDSSRDVAEGVAANTWALWWTGNGSTPGIGSADYTEAMRFDRFAVARIIYDLPAAADGLLVKALLRTRGTRDSVNDEVQQAFAEAAFGAVTPSVIGSDGVGSV